MTPAAHGACMIMSNNACRARSAVGRVARPPGATRRRPFRPPATILTAASPRGGDLGKLLAQDLGRNFLDRATRQQPELKGAIGDADEARGLQVEMRHDAPHLTVPAFPQADRQPGI